MMLKRDNSCQQQGSFTTSSTKNNSDDLSDEEKCITPSSSSSSESQIIEECEESEENVESESFDESRSVIGVQRSSSTLSSSAVTFSSLPPSTTLLTIPTMRQQSSSSEILYDDQNILHQNDLIFRLPPPHVNNNSSTTIQQRQSSSSYSEQPSMLYHHHHNDNSGNMSSFSMQRHHHYSNNNTNQRRVKSKTTIKKNPDSLYKYLAIILLIYFYVWAYMVYYHPSKNNTNQKSLTLLKEQSIKYSDQLSNNKKKDRQNNNLIIPKEIHQDNEPPTDDHKHIIPNILTFTHSINLLPSQQNTQNLTEFYQSLPTPEDAALAQNIQNILKLHSDTTQVNFLTDSDCIEAIQKAFSSSSGRKKSNSLVKYFLAEKQGMYKADICRGAALYNTGGLYMDVDIQPLLNIWTVLQEDTEFVTIKVHKDSHHPDGFFQAFIGVTPQNEIMKRYLEYFLQYYQDKIFGGSAGSMAERVGDHPLGVVLLSYALHDVLEEEEEEEEKTEKGNEEDSHSIELWQEVLYHPKLFPDIEMPKRGMRRACYMYVGIPWMKGVAPFKSRVSGSRMCGGKDSVQKKNKL